MSDTVFKLIELTGTSSKSMEDAVNNALEKAGKTIRNMNWFQVMETRGRIEGVKVSQWQVIIKVGFPVED